MRTLLYAALIAAATVSAPAAQANLLDLAIVDRDSGATLPTYADHGKLYVAGTPGHRYSVRMSNRSGGRVLVVLSVDGVNAVSGETANPDQTGYVLDAWESSEITGWRKNLDEIAQFNFTALPNSYAARTGRPANVGVIGVAVFTESAPVRREREKVARDAAPVPEVPAPPSAASPSAQRAEAPRETSSNSATATGAGALKPKAAQSDAVAKSEERLGTGHGAREYAHVDTTAFERSSQTPTETRSIWYDSYANLVQQGVIPHPIKRADPQAFPGSFVPDPPAH
ncbi:MAG: hypothetical protein ABIS07_08385 [Dokdonella sp.]